jgi:hypothetical protein
MPGYVVRGIADVAFLVEAETPKEAIEKWWERVLRPNPKAPSGRSDREFAENFDDGTSLTVFVRSAWPGHYIQEPETVVVLDRENGEPVLEYTNTKGWDEVEDDLEDEDGKTDD